MGKKEKNEIFKTASKVTLSFHLSITSDDPYNCLPLFAERLPSSLIPMTLISLEFNERLMT